MDREVEFTDEEIREELARLGYKDVPEDKLVDFKKDLMKLIYTERSKSNSLNSSADEIRHSDKLDFDDSPPLIRNSKARDQNFTNHGSQWLDADYKEDWHYRGSERVRPHTAAVMDHRRPNVPSAYSLYEMPFDVQRDRDGAEESRDDFSETDSEKRFVKRKTSRKTEGGSRRVDESFNNNDAAGIYELYERIKNMAMRDCECGKSRPTSASTEPPYRIHGFNKAPSFIRPKEPPHTRNLVRCVPFKRHQMYERLWKSQPAIGDDTRGRIRREVHSKMLQKDEIQTCKKVFVPNTYKVPTEKKRYDLRWAVRMANANYEMPDHGIYHDV